MRTALAHATVPIPPAEAMQLWTDPDRWASFIEGFAHALERSPDWPAEDSRIVWQSIPGGRGRVTEKVARSEPLLFATRVFEEQLVGTQTLRAAPNGPDASEVELSLEYTLTKYGAFRALADLIFIRRALRDALRRTLFRFSVEAQEEAGLR